MAGRGHSCLSFSKLLLSGGEFFLRFGRRVGVGGNVVRFSGSKIPGHQGLVLLQESLIERETALGQRGRGRCPLPIFGSFHVLELLGFEDGTERVQARLSHGHGELLFLHLVRCCGGICLDPRQGAARVGHGFFSRGQGVLDYPGSFVGLLGEEGQADRIDGEGAAEEPGHTRLDDGVGSGMTFIAAFEQPGGRRAWAAGVEYTHQSVEDRIGLARQPVGAHLMRLKDGPDLVVFLLGDGLGHMIMTFGATQRQAQERLRRVFNGVFQPLFAAQHLVIADEKTSGAQGIGVLRCQLIGGQHFHQHPIVGLVLVE